MVEWNRERLEPGRPVRKLIIIQETDGKSLDWAIAINTQETSVGFATWLNE